MTECLTSQVAALQTIDQVDSQGIQLSWNLGEMEDYNTVKYCEIEVKMPGDGELYMKNPQGCRCTSLLSGEREGSCTVPYEVLNPGY
jgi:hypothetical protein